MQKSKWWPATLLSVLGVVLVVCGIYRSELNIIFEKAASICLECIGIG